MDLSIFCVSPLSLCQAEKRRQKREKTNTKKKNKKLNKTAITPTTEPEDKDKEVPRMEVRDLDHMDMLVVRIHAPTDA